MSGASPTPAGAGSHITTLGRRTSARQALRRPTSRPQLSRSESHPASSAIPVPAARETNSQPQQYSTLNDSSDDEIPVPMKLSALTKALLGDGHAAAGPPARGTSNPHRQSSPPSRGTSNSHRQSSPPARPASRVMTRRSAMNASTSSVPDEKESGRESIRPREIRRPARAGSAQLPSSRPSSPVRHLETSPAPARKRVVRLSTTNQPNGGLQSSFQNGLRRSLSSSTQAKRPEFRDLPEEKVAAPPAPVVQPEPLPQQEAPAEINTPVVPVRTVRIAVGSSGSRSRSGNSSGISNRSAERIGHPEEPATINRTTAGAAAPPSSMRVMRVGKTPGSFLSGPARRGRRRHSDEDGDGQGEGGALGSSQEPESQRPLYESALGEQPQSSFLAASHRDFAASGSPVSAKDSIRAAIRKQAASASPPELARKEPEHAHLELAYSIPAPPQIPSTQDKENAPPSTYRRSKPASALELDLNFDKPALPHHVDVGQAREPSPERKVLAAKSQNTPHRRAPPPPPKMSVVETATAAAGASTTAQVNKKRQVLLRVNNRTYTRIDCIGRGGSGKVYRVSAESGKMLALKRVSLENADENTVKGFKGEIDLLKRLAGIDRVIQLIDHELNLEKKMLSVLMEVGELDFNTLLKSRHSSPEGARLDPVFIRYYWKEMLECVAAVHARDVVHSDLKPANFVMVQGQLKLIDFGIANAIQTDMTVNVHRETQIGTPNYMSPESLMDSNQYAFTSAHNGKFCVPPPLQHKGAPKIMKLGKPSDVWSLGCILYQMVYGLPPFGKIANQMSRCQAIINWAYQVDFPTTTEDGCRVPPSLIRTMRRCLNREQKERPTCNELLSDTDPFLYPQEFDPSVYAAAEQGQVLPMTEELLAKIISSVVQRCSVRIPSEGEAVSSWAGGYWTSVRRAVTGANSGSGGHAAGSR
ncbi:kinase-like domain-containing protein [Podospora conica]|nr:kinase-like domain-containing protein [Schizothecium conicum]